MTNTLDDSLLPSPEAEAILRKAGWSPDREVDVSEWVERLRRDGYDVFPLAEAILRSYGGLDLEHRGYRGPSWFDFQVDPSSWYGDFDRLRYIDEVTGTRLCPLGETSGAGMLGVLSDGRVVSELDGDLVLIGDTWRAALQNRLLGEGPRTILAEDYERVEPRELWGSDDGSGAP